MIRKEELLYDFTTNEMTSEIFRWFLTFVQLNTNFLTFELDITSWSNGWSFHKSFLKRNFPWVTLWKIRNFSVTFLRETTELLIIGGLLCICAILSKINVYEALISLKIWILKFTHCVPKLLTLWQQATLSYSIVHWKILKCGKLNFFSEFFPGSKYWWSINFESCSSTPSATTKSTTATAQQPNYDSTTTTVWSVSTTTAATTESSVPTAPSASLS